MSRRRPTPDLLASSGDAPGRVPSGYGDRHARKAWFGRGEARLRSLVSKDRSYKPVVKSSGAQRESDGVVVPGRGSPRAPGKGPDFGRADYREARRRAREVAQATLGPDLWATLQRQGYLDLPSHLFGGVTYRLRVGRRIEVLCPPGVRAPWRHPFLCLNPTYPLPEEEFFAHLYLYVRDREDIVVREAAPQPWDQALGRTF